MERFKLHNLFATILKCFLLFSIHLSISHADNPCGVGCTQTVANNAATIALNTANSFASNAATNALNAANSFTVSAIQAAINTRVYEKIVIFAETSANITTGGGTQWAFGDGDTGVIGVPVVGNWELFAFSIQARSASVTPTNVVINVLDQNTSSILQSFTATLTTSPGAYTEELVTPISVPSGTTIGFTTGSVSAGTVTGARVAAWLRRHPD